MRKIQILLVMAIFSNPIWAQDKASTDEKIEILSKEIEKLKAGKGLFKTFESDKGQYGLGPGASKVYDVDQGLSIGGYGEMLYQNFSNKNESNGFSNKTDEIDALRGIVYIGYKFNDWIVLNTEIELEHADEAFLEFAFLDFQLHDMFNIRAGLLLVPMGLVNELHEPILFYGGNRPETEKRIIPSTWRENGIGIFGSFGNMIDYRAYVISGFDGVGDPTNSSDKPFNSSGLRNGRQKGSNAATEHAAGTARVDFVGINGLLVGASGYYGGSGQENGFRAMTTMADVHLEVSMFGARFRALGAWAKVENADKINAAQGNPLDGTTSGVADELIGGYLELGYNIFKPMGINQEMTVFGRIEHVNTQSVVSEGAAYDASQKTDIYTFGLHYRPIINVVIKADYEINKNEADTGVNQFNFSTGYVF